MDPVERPIPLVDLASEHAGLVADLDQVWRDVVASGRFVGGPAVDAFEASFAERCGVSSCVGVANGTDAIELVLEGLGIGPGLEVVVPANGFVATPEAVVRSGATPVFADVDPATHLVTPETVEAVLTDATAAVIVVHLYGQMPDMAGLGALAERRGVALLEDAAQAHGAAWCGRPAGSFGVAAAFSFYPTKNLGAFGDAGAVVTDDPALAARIRAGADHGRRPGSHHHHDAVGRNSRLDALQAAVLSVKLRRLDERNARRRVASSWYRERLRGSRCRPVVLDARAEPVHYLEVVTVDRPTAVSRALALSGVQTGFHYPVPCHQQAPYARFARGPLPVAERLASRVLSLPMYPSIAEDDVDRVCDALLAATDPLPVELDGETEAAAS